MFLEQIGILTLQVRTKLLSIIRYLLRETDSQLGQIFFTCCLFFLTGLLLYTWTIAHALWLKISFTIIYLVSSLLCISAIYFIIKRKRIRNRSNLLEVYSLKDEQSGKFQHLNLKSIPLTKDQAQAVFAAFSVKYLSGSFHSFNSLVQLEPVSKKDRVEWKDASPKRPELVNRQTLLEFLSHLLIGFENLENHQMIALVEHYFILKNPAGIEQNLSSKNISDWRINKAAYLKEVSRLFQNNL